MTPEEAARLNAELKKLLTKEKMNEKLARRALDQLLAIAEDRDSLDRDVYEFLAALDTSDDDMMSLVFAGVDQQELYRVVRRCGRVRSGMETVMARLRNVLRVKESLAPWWQLPLPGEEKP